MKNNIFDLRVQNIIKKLRHLSKITAVKSNDILLGPPILPMPSESIKPGTDTYSIEHKLANWQ